MKDFDVNAVVRSINDARYGHLERRTCTKESPMLEADEKRYRWTHADAKILMPYFNLVLCECPHCGLRFTCVPPTNGPIQS